MKKYLLQLMMVAMILGFSSVAMAERMYSFDYDNQGWYDHTVGYGGNFYEMVTPEEKAQWTDSYNVGEDGGGSIFQTVTGSEGRAYSLSVAQISPENTLGDLSEKTLGTYIRSTGNWKGFDPSDKVYARWTIKSLDDQGNSNMWVSKASYSIDMNASFFKNGTDDDWVYRNIKLVEANFFQWPVKSNGGSFSSVLKNYTSLGLQITSNPSGSDDVSYFDGTSPTWGPNYELPHYGAAPIDGTGSATWGIDDLQVHSTPEPGTLFLFGSGMCCLAWYSRRNKK